MVSRRICVGAVAGFALLLATVAGGLGCGVSPQTDTDGIFVGKGELPPGGFAAQAILLQPVGRSTPLFSDETPVAWRYSWPGSGFRARFRGQKLWATLRESRDPLGGSIYHVLEIDGRIIKKIAVPRDGKAHRWLLVDNDTVAEHTVRLTRANEGVYSESRLSAVQTDGDLLAASAARYHVEVIGDSISAGYGIEGQMPCHFTLATENHSKTYAALAVRQLHQQLVAQVDGLADNAFDQQLCRAGVSLSTVAWSGKGVRYNASGEGPTLPTLYPRAIPTSSRTASSVLGPVLWNRADVVVINLGTNDYNFLKGSRSAEVIDPFIEAYLGLLRMVRAYHFNPQILCTLAPARSRYAPFIKAAIERFNNEPVEWLSDEVRRRARFIEIHAEPSGGEGCDGHPSAATHLAMAEALRPELSRSLDPDRPLAVCWP
ncbi:MAG: hypothetical protein H6707_19120 [Deltaproteobacteria bacterium]|nr:hypothetical protein [Deltaproteobacteria bacterium]